MSKLTVGCKVKERSYEEIGKVVAIVWEGRSKQYIVQFKNPASWSWFCKDELHQLTEIK